MAAVIEYLIRQISPAWALQRQAAQLALRNLGGYEAAQGGRRTSGWRRNNGDANSAVGPSLSVMRGHARDLCRNNPYAMKAKHIIANNSVSWGIYPRFSGASNRTLKNVRAMYRYAAENNLLDWREGLNMSGMQKLCMRTVPECGESIMVRHTDKNDENPFNFKIEILEGDFIDSSKDGLNSREGAKIILGVELDRNSKRVGYWLFEEHPGSNIGFRGGKTGLSKRFPASDICHIFEEDRPGQIRGITWYSPAIVRLKDLDEYEDATLMRQKIAACFGIAVSDMSGNHTVGKKEAPPIETVEPGMVLHFPPGKQITALNPPTMTDHPEMMKAYLHGIAAGTRCTYEDLTGDYANMPFSAARMSRIAHWGYVRNWQYEMLIPRALNKISAWINQGLLLRGVIKTPLIIDWTPPPMPMIEPDKEGLAIMRNIRAGITTYSEVLRELGRDPDEFLEEYSNDMKLLDKLGIVLDSDARKRTQAGNAVTATKPEEETSKEGSKDDSKSSE